MTDNLSFPLATISMSETLICERYTLTSKWVRPEKLLIHTTPAMECVQTGWRKSKSDQQRVTAYGPEQHIKKQWQSIIRNPGWAQFRVNHLSADGTQSSKPLHKQLCWPHGKWTWKKLHSAPIYFCAEFDFGLNIQTMNASFITLDIFRSAYALGFSAVSLPGRLVQNPARAPQSWLMLQLVRVRRRHKARWSIQ